MNVEIWIQSRQPKWGEWQKLDAIPIKDAIFLSMDVCPRWYEEVVLAAVRNYFDDSEYRPSNADHLYEDFRHIYKAINDEFEERFSIARSWVAKQNWVVGLSPKVPDGIKLSTYVHLKEFLEFSFGTMGYKNEYDSIPLTIRSATQSTEPLLLSSAEWKCKAQVCADELLEKNLDASLDEVAEQIFVYFKRERICTSYAGGKEIALASIKDALSKGGWFTGRRHKLKNPK